MTRRVRPVLPRPMLSATNLTTELFSPREPATAPTETTLTISR